MLTESFNHCPICESESIPVVAINQQFGYRSEICECPVCTIGWMRRQYCEKELRQFYAEEYRLNKAEDNDRRRRLGDRIRSRSQYKFWRDHVAAYHAILEIGAGYGATADYLHSQGWKNVAVNEWDAAHLDADLPAGIRIDRRPIDTYDQGSYNFIILSHVLEHYRDITSTCKTLLHLISPGGLIFLEVPNNLNPYVRAQMTDAFHYYFFTPKSLEMLFSNLGGRVLKWQTYGKERLLGEMGKEDFAAYEKLAMACDDFDDIVALPPNASDAYWLRMLVQSPQK